MPLRWSVESGWVATEEVSLFLMPSEWLVGLVTVDWLTDCVGALRSPSTLDWRVGVCLFETTNGEVR